jgi:8-oxo-dGTP diphosphatase
MPDSIPTSAGEHHPAISVDLVVLTILDDVLHVLLVKRRNEPFAGCWSLPGGRVHIQESLEDAARRVLSEKTGISHIFLEQLYTFGEPDRDPRQRIITVAYYALIPVDTTTVLRAGQAEQDIAWSPVPELERLAFDHEMIIETTLQRLRNKLDYTPVGLELLPEQFTLSELQRVYEIILGKAIDKRNFRKKIRGKDWIERTEGFRRDGPHRPAQLYRFVPPTSPNGSYL